MRYQFLTFTLFLTTSLLAVVDFQEEVWPILEERCVECHKAPYEKNGIMKQPKAGLRLDGAAYIMHGSDDGPVVVVDHPSKSTLYQRIILSEDDADHMPPKGGSLLKRQKEIIRMWIAQGVDFGKWVGAVDGIENLASRKMANQVKQASYLSDYVQLAKGVSPVDVETLAMVSKQSGLLIRPLGVGSLLLEARAVSESDLITDSRIQGLKTIQENIVKLDLRNTAVTNKSMDVLATFPRLKSLNLMGTTVSSQGISIFKKNQKLETLNLVNTEVSDSLIGTLISMPSLRQVYLWKSEFSEEGISLLRRKNTDLFVSF